MTWGFYGRLCSGDQIGVFVDLDRLRKSKRRKARLKSIDDCSGHTKCCAELIFILPATHCLHGLWSCKTESRQDNDPRALAGSRPFLVRLDLFNSKPDYHA